VSNPAGLVLADDATGALECASLLAGLGLRTSLIIDNKSQPGINVIDTESRHLPPSQAAARIQLWLSPAPPAVYKKTDSTLRGNIAAELLAMLQRTVVYIPAYPNLGRTVVNGDLFVHGRPVAETEFAADLRHAIRTSRIADIFPAGAPIENILNPESLAIALNDRTPRILICDAATNADLNRLATLLAQSLNTPWLAGPAGFIPHWAHIHTFPPGLSRKLKAPKKWLIVCGSRHPQSRRQAAHAQTVGLSVISSAEQLHHDPEQIAAELAGQALHYLREQNADALFVMGGDTVWALWRALSITEITPLPEILPGIAASFSPERNLLFVTKAGGFGDDSLVETVLEQISKA